MAQAQTDWTGSLLQVGVAGVMLAWFMWRDNESRKAETARRVEDAAAEAARRAEAAAQAKDDAAQAKALENAINRMARANLILVVSLKQADATAKEKAAEGIKEIDDLK
jgi:hypothetical protein